MKTRYVRIEGRKRDTLSAAAVAAAVAAGVGAVTFYFTRLLLAREQVPPAGDAEAPDDEDG